MSDELVNSFNSGDHDSILPECPLVAISNRFKLRHQFRHLSVCTFNVEDFGLLKFTLPKSFAIDECTIVKEWHDIRIDEGVHHLGGNFAIVWDVATHGDFDAFHVILFGMYLV